MLNEVPIANTFVIIFTGMVVTGLSYLVLKNNHRSSTNKVYVLLSIVLLFWMSANYISLIPMDEFRNLWWIRLSIFFATAMSAMFLIFSYVMPSERYVFKNNKKILVVGLSAMFTMALTLTPLVFRNVVLKDTGPSPVAAPGIGIFGFVNILYVIIAVKVLIFKLRQSEGVSKEQFRYVIAGLLLMMAAIVLTILIPAAFSGGNSFVPFIPVYTLFFLGLTTLAIIRFKLFDIRAVVARSLTYVLTLAFVSLVFGGLVFIMANLFFANDRVSLLQQSIYVVVAVFIAVILQPIKGFFDKITHSIFYKNDYDYQSVLDSIGKVIISEIETKELLNKATKELNKAINPVLSRYVVLSEDRDLYITNGEKTIEYGLSKVTKYLQHHQKATVTLYDNIPGDIAEYIKDNNAYILVKLNSQEGLIGFLLFGAKKSGDSYNAKDHRLFSIISKELSVAVLNSRKFDEIQQFNVTLQDKVDDATKQLRKANERLKQLDQTKDDFISMASHQLRTPLTSVKGYVSMVIEGDAGKISTKQKDLLDQAFLSSQRMVYLIADLLNVSRLRTGKFVVEAKPTNLAEVIEGEIKQLEQTAKAKEQKLTYNKPKNFPTLMFDETKMRQVIMNFADNAVHYVPNGGKIDISLQDLGDSIEFKVVDNGIGVPSAEQHHLFNKFYRAKNAKKARPDGTGLGLFMAKKVVAAQGGAILFNSTEGKGSTFGFTFAKKKVDPSSYKPDIKH